MKTTAVLDGDILLYTNAAATQVEIEWAPDEYTLTSDLKEVKQLIEAEIASIQAFLKADRVVIALSDKDNFRKLVYREYKANRAGKRKPVGYSALVDWVRETYETDTRPWLEADDVLGIWAGEPGVIVVSSDKDLKTVPGSHYNPGTGELFQITQEEADYWVCFQALTGDSTDNYPGLAGVGPVKARKLLEGVEPSQYLDVTMEAFAKADSPWANEMIDVASIMRSEAMAKSMLTSLGLLEPTA